MHLSLLCFELRIPLEVQIGVLNLQAFTNSCFHLLFWNHGHLSVGSPACISSSICAAFTSGAVSIASAVSDHFRFCAPIKISGFCHCVDDVTQCRVVSNCQHMLCNSHEELRPLCTIFWHSLCHHHTSVLISSGFCLGWGGGGGCSPLQTESHCVKPSYWWHCLCKSPDQLDGSCASVACYFC